MRHNVVHNTHEHKIKRTQTKNQSNIHKTYQNTENGD